MQDSNCEKFLPKISVVTWQIDLVGHQRKDQKVTTDPTDRAAQILTP